MYCKRCGASLPSTGFLCTNCGFMMDTEQIKKQREQMQMNPLNQKSQMAGVRFGHKKQLFQKREEASKHSLGLFFFLGFFFLFVLFLLFFVYFR